MDLDQALHIERDGDGYRVRYAIADVPAFVQAGGAVDAETRRRGQTVYAPDKRTPLHPTVLSEGAASLLAGQTRPAFVWDMRLKADGEGTDVEVYRAMVSSTDRLDYEGVQKAIDDGSRRRAAAAAQGGRAEADRVRAPSRWGEPADARAGGQRGRPGALPALLPPAAGGRGLERPDLADDRHGRRRDDDQGQGRHPAHHARPRPERRGPVPPREPGAGHRVAAGDALRRVPAHPRPHQPQAPGPDPRGDRRCSAAPATRPFDGEVPEQRRARRRGRPLRPRHGAAAPAGRPVRPGDLRGAQLRRRGAGLGARGAAVAARDHVGVRQGRQRRRAGLRRRRRGGCPRGPGGRGVRRDGGRQAREGRRRRPDPGPCRARQRRRARTSSAPRSRSSSPRPPSRPARSASRSSTRPRAPDRRLHPLGPCWKCYFRISGSNGTEPGKCPRPTRRAGRPSTGCAPLRWLRVTSARTMLADESDAAQTVRVTAAAVAADAHDGVLTRTSPRSSSGITRQATGREVAAGRWRAHGRHTIALHTGELSAAAQRWRAVWEVGCGRRP